MCTNYRYGKILWGAEGGRGGRGGGRLFMELIKMLPEYLVREGYEIHNFKWNPLIIGLWGKP